MVLFHDWLTTIAILSLVESMDNLEIHFTQRQRESRKGREQILEIG